MCVRIELVTLNPSVGGALTSDEVASFTPDNLSPYASPAKIIGHLFGGFGSKKWQSFYKGLWLEDASWTDNDR